MTSAQLQAIMPLAKNIETFLPHFNKFMPIYEIDNRLRQAAFLANVAHESGQLKFVREIASGNAYEGREDLGNKWVGDGVKFKGRGLIQVTGRDNYYKCSMALFGDDRLVKNPDILATPMYAVQSACWFWASRGLNRLADRYLFTEICKRVNGGVNGLPERKQYYKQALKVL